MLEKIAINLELRLTDIQKIIGLLLSHDHLNNNDLVRLSGLPKTQLQRLLTKLKDYLEPSSQFCQLRPEMKVKLKNSIHEANRTSQKSKIVNLLSQYQKVRPDPDRSLDQFYATINTSARRAVLIAKNGDIDNRSIAILGDDDLNSVAVALAGKATRITVFEKDSRILSLVEKIAHDHNLAIDLVEFDLLKKFPEKYLHQFDTIFSDPPYTPGGISLFLNRGVELMKDHLLSRFYLCYGNSDRARERELEIQKIILGKGLLIKEKKYQFSYYRGADSIGDRSSLYLLDWTPQTKTVINNNQKIYSFE
jgi:predicted methyltransferase